jgi:(1->4)-alpha-D-glucan 1-alpha-D-glucosylmutase
MRPEAATFRNDFIEFHKFIAFFGRLNGLSQVLLKMTCPGVPDFYQGSELWDLRLVDPDNRHPVDFALRKKLFESLGSEGGTGSVDQARQLWSQAEDSRIKLYLIRHTLSCRRLHPELFSNGRFLTLTAAGLDSPKLFSFARCDGDQWCLVIVPRWQAQGRNVLGALEIDWHDTRIALPPNTASSWSNIFTGVTTKSYGENGKNWLKLKSVLCDFPVALLVPSKL